MPSSWCTSPHAATRLPPTPPSHRRPRRSQPMELSAASPYHNNKKHSGGTMIATAATERAGKNSRPLHLSTINHPITLKSIPLQPSLTSISLAGSKQGMELSPIFLPNLVEQCDMIKYVSPPLFHTIRCRNAARTCRNACLPQHRNVLNSLKLNSRTRRTMSPSSPRSSPKALQGPPPPATLHRNYASKYALSARHRNVLHTFHPYCPGRQDNSPFRSPVLDDQSQLHCRTWQKASLF